MKHINPDMSEEEFLQLIVKMANGNSSLLDGVPDEQIDELLGRIFGASDVVYGVWKDPAADYGIDYVVIQGRKLLDEAIVETGLKMTAIYCDDHEHAEALAKELENQDKEEAANAERPTIH